MTTVTVTYAALLKAREQYRRTYDRLYVQSMRADSAEESARINAALAAAERKRAAVETAYAKERA